MKLLKLYINFFVPQFNIAGVSVATAVAVAAAAASAATSIAGAVGSEDAGTAAAAAAGANASGISKEQQDSLKSARDTANKYQFPYYNTGTAGQNELAYRLGLTNQVQMPNDTSLTAYQAQLKQRLSALNAAPPDKKNKAAFDKWNQQKQSINKQLKAGEDNPNYKTWVSKQPTTKAIDRPIDANFGSLLDGKFNFEADPGYQFRLDQGNKALDNRLSSQGMQNSGLALKDAIRFNQGEANQTYSDAWARYMADKQLKIGTLQNMAGTGQNAANQISNNENSYGANLSNAIGQKGQAQQDAIYQGANAQMAGNQAIGNSVNSGISNLYQTYKDTQGAKTNVKTGVKTGVIV